MSNVIRVTVSMSPDLLEEFDRSRAGQSSPNRSEAVRRLMQDAVKSETSYCEDRMVVETLTLNYRQHCAELARRLTAIQHDGLELVVSTTRVHIDADLCLEVLIMKGRIAELSDLASRLCGTKGVLHGELVVATTHGAWRVLPIACDSRK